MTRRTAGVRSAANTGRFVVLGVLLVGLIFLCGNACPSTPSVNVPLPGRGTIEIDPRPVGIQAPWYLERVELRSDYYWEGTGSDTLHEMRPGRYTIEWGEVVGYDIYETPVLVQHLYDDESFAFDVTYELLRGDIVVVVEPFEIEASWVIEGPSDYEESGSGEEILEKLPPGQYTVYWGDAAGYVTPADSTGTHVAGADLVFLGVYAPE